MDKNKKTVWENSSITISQLGIKQHSIMAISNEQGLEDMFQTIAYVFVAVIIELVVVTLKLIAVTFELVWFTLELVALTLKILQMLVYSIQKVI